MLIKNTKVKILIAAVTGFILGGVLVDRWVASQAMSQAKFLVLYAVLAQSKQVQLLSAVSNGLDKRSTEQTKKYLCASMKVSVDAMNSAKNEFVESIRESSTKEMLDKLEMRLTDLKIAELEMQSAKCPSV